VRARRLIPLLLLIVTGALVYIVGWSSFLTITSVNISTSDPKNIALIEAQLTSTGLGIEVGDPLARINGRAIERSLKTQTWIGEVEFTRNWVSGAVALNVREQIPQFIVRELGMVATNSPERFMTADGALFNLPGDLATEYRGLPKIEIRGGNQSDRISAASLFDRINVELPTDLIIVTPLSTLITESLVPFRGKSEPRSVRITWGSFAEVEKKKLVLFQLASLKANRTALRIDLSNPQLPIVSNR
jgi:hypothetical protein